MDLLFSSACVPSRVYVTAESERVLKSLRVSCRFLDAVDSGRWLQPISRWVLTLVLAEHSVSFIRRVQLGKKQSKLHWSISHQLANLGQICRGQRLDIRAEA